MNPLWVQVLGEMNKHLKQPRHAVGDVADASFLFVRQSLETPTVEDKDRAWALRVLGDMPSILAPKHHPPAAAKGAPQSSSTGVLPLAVASGPLPRLSCSPRHFGR